MTASRTATVTNKATVPGGVPKAFRDVTIRLNAPGFTDGGTAEVLDQTTERTDGTGVWSATLAINDDIDPAGTYYTVRESSGVIWAFQLTAAQAGVTVALRSVLVTNPTNPNPVILEGGSGVTTVFGRPGNVLPQAGDYAAFYDGFGAASTAQAAAASDATSKVAAEATARAAAISAAIANLINSAPGALDTLNELATALGDDPNFATTITNALAGKQPLDSDLTTIAALDATQAGVVASDGAGWLRKSYAALKTALGLVKADVGLGNVDNTSDVNKPVSTAQAAADTAVQTAAASDATAKVAAEATARANADALLAALTQVFTDVAVTATASAALVANKHNPINCGSASLSMSLPTGKPGGTLLSVERVDSTTANTCTITGSIRGVGSSSLTLLAPGSSVSHEAIVFLADASGSWWPIAGHKTKAWLDATYLASNGVTLTGTPSAGMVPIASSGTAAAWGNLTITGQYVGSASTFATLPTTDAAGQAVSNGDWAILTADVVGTGTTANPQYPRGIYVTNGTVYSLAASMGPEVSATGVTAGSYGDATHVVTFTVDATGRITAASVTSIQIVESQVTNLTTDLAAKVPLSTVTTKGDLIVGTGSAAVARVAAGTDTTQTLVPDSSQTAGVKWAQRFIPPEFAQSSGDCWVLSSSLNATGTTLLTVGREIAIPFYITSTVTISKLYAEVTTAATGGANPVRLGIRAHDPTTGQPKSGAPLVDGGTIDGTSVSVQSVTLGSNLTLTPGWYWHTITGQGTPTTQATMRGCTTVPPAFPAPLKAAAASSISAVTCMGYYQNSVTAALPSTWTYAGVSGLAPRMIAQAA